MSTEELRKAVEALGKVLAFAGSENQEDWQTIRQALRDQEAEIARLREDLADVDERAALRSRERTESVLRTQKAEALLREIRDSTHKSALMLRAMADRHITAHLGGEQ